MPSPFVGKSQGPQFQLAMATHKLWEYPFLAEAPVEAQRPDRYPGTHCSYVIKRYPNVRTWMFMTEADRDAFLRDVPDARVVEHLPEV